MVLLVEMGNSRLLKLWIHSIRNLTFLNRPVHCFLTLDLLTKLRDVVIRAEQAEWRMVNVSGDRLLSGIDMRFEKEGMNLKLQYGGKFSDNPIAHSGTLKPGNHIIVQPVVMIVNFRDIGSIIIKPGSWVTLSLKGDIR